MEDVLGIAITVWSANWCVVCWRDQTRVCKQLIISSGSRLALRIPCCQMWQFHPQHCRLNVIHAAVCAQFVVVITFRAAMIAQTANMLSGFFVACSHEASIAVSA